MTRLFEDKKRESIQRASWFISRLQRSGLVDSLEDYVYKHYSNIAKRTNTNEFEYFFKQVSNLHKKYVTELNNSEEDFLNTIVVIAYYDKYLNNNTFLETFDDYLLGKYDSLFGKEEDIDWGDLE